MTVSSVLKTLSVATVAMAATVSAIAPAQALSLNGSIGLEGDANIPSGQNLPNLTIGFSGIQIDSNNRSGDFTGVTSATIADLNLVLDEADVDLGNPLLGTFDVYRLTNNVSNFIDFGTQTIDGETGELTFDLDAGGFIRLGNGDNFGQIVGAPGITGTFQFNGNTFAQGFLSASRSGDADTFELTLSTQVPEPFTILGSLSALGVGTLMKKQHEKRQTKA
ncbi:MAG: PEP-CTERM sorting domain-containing protein [Cyanobacteria bacterium J06592_8]